MCTDPQDADTKINEFLHQLLALGHSRDSLEPLFCPELKKTRLSTLSAMTQQSRKGYDLRKPKLQRTKSTSMSNSILMTHQQGKSKSYVENMWLTQPMAPPSLHA
jgi:hypothetical protein